MANNCDEDEGHFISEGTEVVSADDCVPCKPAVCSPRRVVRPSCAPTTCAPRPYYTRVPTCREDSREQIVETIHSQMFKSAQSFAMPACATRVKVVFDSMVDVPIGADLWAYGFGLLRITGSNTIAQEIELENLCAQDGCPDQAAPGVPIPCGTLFVLTPPRCPSGVTGPGNLFPYLAVSFTAPVIGNCVDVTVTNVNGLSVGKNISFNNGIYRISAINSATNITICDDGAGLTPGVPVEAKDAAGNFLVPVVLIDSNPCLNAGVPSGLVMVCVDGTMQVIIPSEDGQVLVGNAATGVANYRTLGIPTLECTELTVALTLDPALPPGTSYLVQVQDSSAYIVTQIVTIGGTEFTVDTIDSVTQMHIIPTTDPTAVQTYGMGSTLCSADCCTLLNARVLVLESAVSEPDATIGGGLATIAAEADATAIVDPTVLDGGSPTLAGEIASLTITNPSALFSMKVHYAVEWNYVYDLIGAAADVQDVGRFASLIADPNPVAVPTLLFDYPTTHIYQDVTGALGQDRFSFNASFNGVLTLLPGASTTLRANGSMSWNSGNATQANVKILGTRISYIGVASPVA